jgi:uncharacterized protein (TIGR02001 family)
MRTSFGPLLGLALVTLSTPAFAEEAEETPAVTINGTATVVSDYRFRGISQTDKDFALQGSITLTHKSGFYASVWGSSIDDYVAAGSDQELDLIVGFKKTFGGTTVDVGVLYYVYPGNEKLIPGYDANFIEPYASVAHTFGPVTAKVSAAYAPKQSALSVGFGKEDNLYLAGDLSGSLGTSGVSLTGHIGHSFGPSFLTIGKGYTDYSVGASYTWKSLTLGVSYVDTNKSLLSLTGKNISKGGVVGTLGVSF